MKKHIKKVFLDSSVLVAASASLAGASSYILGLCKEMKLNGYVCPRVIGEAKKNIELKLGVEERKRFKYFLEQANLYLVSEASPEKIAESEKVINSKDAPILAAARQSPTDFLITLDKKHFLRPEVLVFAKPFKIIKPGDFIRKYF